MNIIWEFLQGIFNSIIDFIVYLLRQLYANVTAPALPYVILFLLAIGAVWFAWLWLRWKTEE